MNEYVASHAIWPTEEILLALHACRFFSVVTTLLENKRDWGSGRGVGGGGGGGGGGCICALNSVFSLVKYSS